MDGSPVTLTFAWWGTALLRGATSPDAFLDALAEHAVAHVVVGGAGAGVGPGAGAGAGDAGTRATGGPGSLVDLLGLLRALGVDGVGAAYPSPGDPVGLGGPAVFNAAALEAGEAVVAVGGDVGWVPSQVGAAVEWTAHPAHRRPVPDVGEADRALRAGLLEALDGLARLDVARWNPDLADELLHLGRAPAPAPPPGVPARCADLAARALRMLRVVELGRRDDGGALSAAEATARSSALVDLDRLARRALTAAASPEAWPPA